MAQSGIHKVIRPLLGLWRSSCQILWPAVCQVCGEPIDEDGGRLCKKCWQGLSETVGFDYCRRCGRQVSQYGIVENRCGGCLEEQLEYDGLCRVGFYGGTLKQLLLGFKFHDQTENIEHIGPMFLEAFRTSGFSEKIEILVPVPLHWRRRFERGFNQSMLLARSLKDVCPYISTELVRTRYTPHQWQLENDSQRRRNVKNAFAVRKEHPFEDKTVCLVDDITTSGATLKECALTLREAGAKAVFAAVAAVAERQQ